MASETTQTNGISRDEILERQVRTRELANQKQLDALLVVGRSAYDRPGHLAYLTNHFPPFPSTPFTQTDRGMGYGILFLPVDGNSTLLVDRPSEAALRRDMVAVDEVQVAPDWHRQFPKASSGLLQYNRGTAQDIRREFII